MMAYEEKKDWVALLKSSAAGMGIRNTDDYSFTLSVTQCVEIAAELERLYKIEKLWDNTEDLNKEE